MHLNYARVVEICKALTAVRGQINFSVCGLDFGHFGPILNSKL